MIRKQTEKDLTAIMQIWLETNTKAHSFIPPFFAKKNPPPYFLRKEIAHFYFFFYFCQLIVYATSAVFSSMASSVIEKPSL